MLEAVKAVASAPLPIIFVLCYNGQEKYCPEKE